MIDSNIEEKIQYQYRTLLGREADPGGLMYWNAEAERTGDIQTVIDGIKTSIEYKKLLDARALHKKTVFSNIACLARPERIEKLTFNGRSRPLTLSVETVNICNNDCIICPYSSQTRAHQTMSIELFGKILDDYTLIGGGNLALTPFVGEILLDKHLLTRLEMIKKSGIVSRLSVTTNGVMAHLFDDPTLEYIIHSFYRIWISIYGMDAEEYKAMTRKDEYEKALENICRILRFSKGNIVLGIRHLKKRSSEDIYKWVENLKNRANYKYPLEVIEDMFVFNNWSIFNTNTKLPFDAKWRPAPTHMDQCLLPLLYTKITSAGDLSFCACVNFDASEELLLGNIKNYSLLELYNNEKCRKLWNWKSNGIPEFCRTCSFYQSLDVIEQQPTIFSDLPLG